MIFSKRKQLYLFIDLEKKFASFLEDLQRISDERSLQHIFVQKMFFFGQMAYIPVNRKTGFSRLIV